MPTILLSHPIDNVGVVSSAQGMAVSETATLRDLEITAIERIPYGHKIALVNIAAGTPVTRYGITIGIANREIARGGWVHERLLSTPDSPTIEAPTGVTHHGKPLDPLEGYEFMGFRNASGSVGTRNVLAVTTTVQCVAGVVSHAVARIKSELLPRYEHVDDVVGLEHGYGCGVAIDAPDAIIPVRTLRNISLNPNFGEELLVVSLGCEKLQPSRLIPPGSIPIHSASGANEALDVVCLQEVQDKGFEAMIQKIMAQATIHLERLNKRQRVKIPASELVVGVQCGGSDALSGLTANAAVGFATDLLVRCGATVMFSENTEVRDAVDQLMARAETHEVATAISRELSWYDAYLARGGADRAANTTPGNKAGGLANIVEKAMGSVVKSGTSPIKAVLAPGEKLACDQRGLVFAATPASDFVCGTLQLAAGMNMHVFTTGRGTPYGLAACPVIKVSTNSALAKQWFDLIDVDAGGIAEGQETVESVGWALFHSILRSASGERTWAEKHRLHNALTLFNPAPLT